MPVGETRVVEIHENKKKGEEGNCRRKRKTWIYAKSLRVKAYS